MQGSWKKQKSNEAEKQKKHKEAEKQSKARNQESKKKNTQTGKYPQINNSPIYIYIWLVVWTPLKNISQLGWLATQYMGK